MCCGTGLRLPRPRCSRERPTLVPRSIWHRRDAGLFSQSGERVLPGGGEPGKLNFPSCIAFCADGSLLAALLSLCQLASNGLKCDKVSRYQTPTTIEYSAFGLESVKAVLGFSCYVYSSSSRSCDRQERRWLARQSVNLGAA